VGHLELDFNLLLSIGGIQLKMILKPHLGFYFSIITFWHFLGGIYVIMFPEVYMLLMMLRIKMLQN